MEPVLVSLAAGVLRITLNRPKKLNAFTAALHEGLADAMTRACFHEIRVPLTNKTFVDDCHSCRRDELQLVFGTEFWMPPEQVSAHGRDVGVGVDASKRSNHGVNNARCQTTSRERPIIQSCHKTQFLHTVQSRVRVRVERVRNAVAHGASSAFHDSHHQTRDVCRDVACDASNRVLRAHVANAYQHLRGKASDLEMIIQGVRERHRGDAHHARAVVVRRPWNIGIFGVEEGIVRGPCPRKLEIGRWKLRRRHAI